MWPLRSAGAVAALTAGIALSAELTVHWVPHSHDDVGWLQTTTSLHRQNVSHIIDGVLGQLTDEADPGGIRRFSWEEVAWLRFWWMTATESQKQAMRAAQRSGRLGFYDSGITQHDNACPDMDSMISNWEAGWRVLNFTVGRSALPRTAASLDPFGLSASNGALLRYAGMQDWVFWRMPRQDRERLGNMSALDFEWRPSSSVPAVGGVLVHETWLSYCIPHDFEFGQPGVSIPSSPADFQKLATELKGMIAERAPTYPTDNLMFLDGCDYHFQHAQANYDSGQKVLELLNGTSVTIPGRGDVTLVTRFSTAEEYFSAVRRDSTGGSAAVPSSSSAVAATGSSDTATDEAAVQLHVKQDGGDFFTYSYNYGDPWWAGYFVSRPLLKQRERRVTSAVRAAGIARATVGLARGAAAEPEDWEDAQAAAAILTHHDAITGTACAAEEGCTGKQEMSGAHDVVSDYHRILDAAGATASSQLAAALGAGPTAAESLQEVAKAAAAGDVNAATLAAGHLARSRAAWSYWSQAMNDRGYAGSPATDPRQLAAVLEAGLPGYLTVFNPSGGARTDALYVPMSVCDADVELVGGSMIGSKIGSVPVFEIKAQTWINDLSPYSFILTLHVQHIPPLGTAVYKITPHVERCTAAQLDLDQHEVLQGANGLYVRAGTPEPPPIPKRTIERIENGWIAVDIDTWTGPASWIDKTTGRKTSFTHGLVCRPAHGDAYAINRTHGGDESCDGHAAGQAPYQVSVHRGTATQEVRIRYTDSFAVFYRLHVGPTANASAGLGAMLHVEGRLGVLPPGSDVSSRFDVGIDNSLPPRMSGQHCIGCGDRAADGTSYDWAQESSALRGSGIESHGATSAPWMYGAQNGYEVVGRRWNGSLVMPGDGNMFPVQADVFLRGNWAGEQLKCDECGRAQAGAPPPFPVPWLDGSQAQLTVVVDRSHAAGMTNTLGRLELLHHRRTQDHAINPAIVLDDTSRVMARLMVALGEAGAANRQRHALWERSRDPLSIVYSNAAPEGLGLGAVRGGAVELPEQVRLYAMHVMSDGQRWSSPDYKDTGSGSMRTAMAGPARLLIRLQHRYAAYEDADLSKPVQVDLSQFVEAATGGAVGGIACEQTTLTGHLPAIGLGEGRRVVRPSAAACNVTLGPLSIATVVAHPLP